MAAKNKKKVTSKTSSVKNATPVKKTDNSLLMLLVATVLVVTSYWLFTHFNSQPNYLMMNPNVTTTHSSPSINGTRIIQLNEQNGSGEFGNATFSEENGKTIVKVQLKNAPKGVSQPAHIHIGSCIDMGKIEYPLTNVVNGESTTTLDVTLTDLQKKSPLTLNVHKSTSQAGKYVSCGNLNF